MLAPENWEGGNVWLSVHITVFLLQENRAGFPTAHVLDSITRTEPHSVAAFTNNLYLPFESSISGFLSPSTHTSTISKDQKLTSEDTFLLQTSSILNVRVGRDLRDSSPMFYNLSLFFKSCGIFLFKYSVLWKLDA